ncbi:MAG: hypothetical protein ACO395_06980 [Pontimonas sp.]
MPKVWEVSITGFYVTDEPADAVRQYLREFDHIFIHEDQAEGAITHVQELPLSFYSDEEWEAING